MSENDKMVDWYLLFGKRIKTLKTDETISIVDKREFLEGLVQKIIVTEKNDQEHTLKIMFRQPYVSDKLVWNHPTNKRKGYVLKNGKKIKNVNCSLSKKTRSVGG